MARPLVAKGLVESYRRDMPKQARGGRTVTIDKTLGLLERGEREHHEHLGHLLWEVFSRISALGEARFSKLELSRPSLGLLDVIATQPGISIAEIARQQPKTQQAISQVVARLESIGMVERKLVKGRTIGLYLTTLGTKARNEGAAAELAFEKELEALLGKDKYERLRKQLLDVRAPLIEAMAVDEEESAPRTRR